jgi:primosomal replication protein N
MNKTTLSAHLLERGPLRYTPAGLPVCDFKLKHESQLTEAQQLRLVSLEIQAVVFGEMTEKLLSLGVGHLASFAGFLTNQRNGRGVLFHVTELTQA